VQVFADQYPYEASGTGIVGALMPRSAQVGGRDAMMKRITGELRSEIRAEVKANIARRGGADTLMISRYSVNPSFEGQRLSVLAAKAGVAPEEYALQLLEKGDASLVSFNMSEGDIESIMRQPWTMTCTDGDLVRMGVGVPHPRAYGAFARKLKKYVAERGTIDIAAAVRSMTSLPATVYGLKDRGQLRAGAFADILIFDLSKVNDSATYEKPHQLSEGIDDIIVNGELARRNGRFTSTLAGRVLRPQRN
jgi:N-acyl-D-aspartate/D-glutamate deacylase